MIRLLQRKHEPPRHFWPVKHMSFSVYPGDSLGILGPNGSGKSTLLKLITGILEPTSGEVVTSGRISSLLELGAGFHPDLTGRENVFLNGSIVGISHKQMLERLDSIIDFAELGDFIDIPIKHYSSGMYVRLGFAVAVHTDPDLLLVDEVLAVGDAEFQHKCMDRIQKFRDAGGTLLLVSHDLGTIQSICKQAIWIDHGEVQAFGQPTDVVMEYLNHVSRKEESSSNTRPRVVATGDRRWGSGRVKVTRVEICDGYGKERSIFVTGCPMQIRICYKTEERVEDPVFGLAIHHQNGYHVTGPNSAFGGLTIPSAEGEGCIVYDIPSLPLLEGGYLLSISSHNRADTEMYDYHDRTYEFRVYPGSLREGYGIITLGGRWRLDTPPTPVLMATAHDHSIANANGSSFTGK